MRTTTPKSWTKKRILMAIGLALLAGSLSFCSPIYILRAGLAEAEILRRRQPISDVVAAPGTPAATRQKLELVRMARTYADRELRLDVGDSYTTYSEVDSDTLLLVVQASRKDAFQPVTWWFPIVGRVPYKGFFDPEDALEEARELEAGGYDTYVRPSAAFSTLGWFNDPLLSTVLDHSDIGLASTVIHEVTHNTIYLPGRAGFNESFANFVGDVGAAELFCGIEGEAGARCRAARRAWSDAVVFGEALQQLVTELEAVYGRADLSSTEKVAARDQVIDHWKRTYAREVVPRLHYGFRTFHEREINNAMLMGLRLYYDRLDLFDRVYRELNLPLGEAVARMIEAAESSPEAPFEAVARLAGD